MRLAPWAAVALTLHAASAAGQSSAPKPALIAKGALLGLGLHATIREQSYPAPGRTPDEVLRRLRFGGPPGSGREEMHGLTVYDLAPTWLPVRESHGCVVRDARIDASITVHLPRWTRSDEASEHDRGQWAEFLTALQDHEHAHRDVTLRTATALVVSLRHARAGSCPRLVRIVSGMIRRARASLRVEHAALDAAYRRGARD